jgi:phosphoribosylanthranilate isomerase
MFVKICGITRAEDAVASVVAGAGAVGFVFWPNSPRAIDPKRAREIREMLPLSVMAVGVFVNQPAEDVLRIAETAALDAVQLHGDETPEYAARIERAVIKAVPIDGGEPDLSSWPAHVMLLLDAHDPIRRGGTGRSIDWEAAAGVARRRRTILAGGLSAENVAAAIDQVQPFGIDVSSGVERAPGIKDHGRIRALFEALHGNQHSQTRS